ncbi:hypothetical protein ICN48_06180 [Polynucleobacter sp. JS-Safj-400b-B2]|uniref:hypothetical protein n=1 Tax=Polynucleobacter sp. JS-Safj-400b-B2 TaxID=2576921 RepID=UPI001C0DB7BF|nr:hypothetical protein [Polynucleobacter sp. JS-Safj-400b-B2]MBU3625819.1 hypothetical protein [Polynucleobacter sp. JS-Safj-400b-B2]
MNNYLTQDGSSMELTVNTYVVDGHARCKYCLSPEVSYDQRINDAYCGSCGEWQNDCPLSFKFKPNERKIDATDVISRKDVLLSIDDLKGAKFSMPDSPKMLFKLLDRREVLVFKESIADYFKQEQLGNQNNVMSVFRANAGNWMIKPVPGQVLADVCESGDDQADYAAATLLASSQNMLSALKLIAAENRDDASPWMRGVARSAISVAEDVSGYQPRTQEPSEVVIGFDPHNIDEINEKIKLLEQYREHYRK